MRFHSRTYAVLLALALILALAGAVHAAVVGISPASANATVGDTLLLTVGVDQASDLGGFQFGISYDPAALGINTVTVNSAFDLPVMNQFDNITGKGTVAASVYSSPTLSGTGLPLAVISFTVKSSGTTSVGLANVILGRIGGTEIPSTSAGAVVSAVPGAGPPAVTQVSPVNGASLVPVGTAVVASFSVPMNSSTIDTASFLLIGPSGAVAGSVVASGQTATFTPASALASNTTYTATVTTAAKDLAGGIGLAADYTWSFTTLLPTRTITASAGTNGGITPSGAVVVSEGTSTTFIIQPNTGYSVQAVMVDLVSQGSVTTYTFSNVTADHTISASFVDDIKPVGTITINSGALYTNNPSVLLSLTCSDAGSGCSQMQLSNDGIAWSGPASFATGTAWTLAAIEGAKNVHARFTDVDGNQSLSVIGTITLDMSAPTTTLSAPGGNYPANQSVTLTCNDGLGAGCAFIRYTIDDSDPLVSGLTYTAPVLISGPTTTLKFFAVDLAGNAELIQTQVYVIDANMPQITNVAPASGSFVNSSTVSYTLNKLMASGSVVYTRMSGTADAQSPHSYTMILPSDLSAGSHIVTDPVALVDSAVYSIAFSATDGVTSAPTVTVTNITHDQAAAGVTITSPTSGGRVNTPAVSYLLSEPTTSGRIVIDDGSVPFVHILSGAELTAGAHAVTTSAVLVHGMTYTFSITNVTDRAGNASPPANVPNVTFDTMAVVISNTSPVTKSIITTPTVTYTLSEQAASGTVLFTRSGGRPDAASPHLYTMTVSDLTGTTHGVTPPVTLVDGTFYTVSFAATDMAGNPATTVSNALVFFDSQYGKGPMGNVDNTGTSADIVDNADVIKLQDALGTRPGDGRWNPVCDLDRNNVIDARDLMILHSHYGQTGQ
ncbi:MAG: Ig-like domain-containing protein [Nitrospirota bacterium]